VGQQQQASGVISAKKVRNDFIDFMFGKDAQPPKSDSQVAGIVDGLGIRDDLVKTTGVNRVVFVLKGVHYQIANMDKVRLMFGSDIDSKTIDTIFSGLVFFNPAAADAPKPDSLNMIPGKPASSAASPETNWLYICPDCKDDSLKNGSDKPAPAADLGSQGQAPPTFLTYNIDRPCAKAIAATLDQINNTLVQYGLRAILKTDYRAFQVFIQSN
jgi:hypothetical protein